MVFMFYTNHRPIAHLVNSG